MRLDWLKVYLHMRLERTDLSDRLSASLKTDLSALYQEERVLQLYKFSMPLRLKGREPLPLISWASNFSSPVSYKLEPDARLTWMAKNPFFPTSQLHCVGGGKLIFLFRILQDQHFSGSFCSLLPFA